MSQPPCTARAVGIDIGGTMMKSALLNSAAGVLRDDQRPTPEGRAALIAQINAVLAAIEVDASLPLGIACPGIAEPDHRAIACMPGRMAGLEGLAFGAVLGREVFVLNDAHAATLAEMALGAAAGRRHVVMLTLGTGVGGGVIIDGRLYTGASGRAGHLGHISIDASGDPDICNLPGSIEDAIGNHSVSTRTAGRFSSTRELVEAVRNGDAAATKTWHDAIDRLAVALASLINAFDPEVIVLGGGIIVAGDILFNQLADAMDRVEWRPLGKAVPIVPASLGAQAGAIGAALFALRPELRP